MKTLKKKQKAKGINRAWRNKIKKAAPVLGTMLALISTTLAARNYMKTPAPQYMKPPVTKTHTHKYKIKSFEPAVPLFDRIRGDMTLNEAILLNPSSNAPDGH